MNADEHNSDAPKNKGFRNKWRRMALSTKMTVIFTGVIAVCTLVYSTVSGFELSALTAANQINKTAFDRAYRPYIGVNGAQGTYAWKDKNGNWHLNDIRIPQARILSIRVEMKNFGPVPGSNFVARWKVFVGGVEQKQPPAQTRPSTFFPGQTRYLSGEIGTTDFPEVVSGRKSLYCEITIEYDGPTGHYQECNKEQYSPDTVGFADLGPCPQ